MTSALSPVVVFAYARADHLRRTVESLQCNSLASETDVVFYCDAAKRPEHQSGVEAVRTYVQAVEGFRSVRCILRRDNMGLARSVVDGVTQTVRERGRVIVLEDDLVLSPHFLRYMNDALERYAEEPRVASIHGYSYPTGETLPPTFFLRGADCWGWATWSRAWSHFDADGSRLLRQLKSRRLTHHFDFGSTYPFTSMLEDQIKGRNSSWAILWHASCYLQNLLTLYPGRSLVENIGNDAAATHGGHGAGWACPPTQEAVPVDPITLEASEPAWQAFRRFFERQNDLKDRFRLSLRRLARSWT